MKKFKKFTAIVLTAVMITAFIPSMSFANEIILGAVDIIGLNRKVYATEHPDFDARVPENGGYHLATQAELKKFGLPNYESNHGGIWWKDLSDYSYLSRTDTFKAGPAEGPSEKYQFSVVLVREPGYKFGFSAQARFDGETELLLHYDYEGDYMIVTGTRTAKAYKAIIDLVDITDLEIPECGVKPDYDLTIPENQHYHFASAEELKEMGEDAGRAKNGVWWEDNQRKCRQEPDRGYLPGKERYAGRIALICDKECKFGDNLKITINGERRAYRGYKLVGKDSLLVKTVNFDVEPGNIADFELGSGYVKTDENTYKVIATGEQILPEPLVKSKSGKLLNKGEHYKVTYSSDIVKPGHYQVTVEGLNPYTGTITKNVIVTPEPVTGVKVRHSTATGGYDDAYLTWNPSEDVTGYQVYARRPSKTKEWTFLGRTQKTSFLKKDLYDGWKYEFLVYPYVDCNDERYRTMEDYSVVAMTTLKKAYRPSAQKYNSSRVRISWKDIYGESGYQIRASRTGKTTYLRTTGKAMNIKVAKGKQYTYKVRAYKYVTKNGEKVRVYGPWSDSRTYTLR